MRTCVCRPYFDKLRKNIINAQWCTIYIYILCLYLFSWPWYWICTVFFSLCFISVHADISPKLLSFQLKHEHPIIKQYLSSLCFTSHSINFLTKMKNTFFATITFAIDAIIFWGASVMFQTWQTQYFIILIFHSKMKFADIFCHTNKYKMICYETVSNIFFCFICSDAYFG